MAEVAGIQLSQEVIFRLCCFSTQSNETLLKFLSPEGTLLVQFVQFPVDFADCTCIPIRGVTYLIKAGVTDEAERQWFKPLESIERKDIPAHLTGSQRVMDYICHQRRPDPKSYPLSILTVDGHEVQIVAFIGKSLLFRRLGQEVVVDLRSVPDNQPFALAVDWSPTHIEARVTWVEGEGMEGHYSGVGVPFEQWEHYRHPEIGEVVQFREKREFDALLIPAPIARAIWRSAESSIDDSKQSPDVLFPRKSYADHQDFLQSVLEIIRYIQQTVLKSKPYAFWDNDQPKIETHAGSILRGYFEMICATKNILVHQEDPSRSGNVDFEFTAISLNLTHLQIVLEIKKAHSSRIEHGLKVQLPTYLHERGVPVGIYGVLWYKGTNFDKPNDLTLDDCLTRLDAQKPQGVVSVVGFDLSFPVQASKKSKMK